MTKHDDIDAGDRLLTIAAVGRILGLSPPTVRGWIRDGTLPSIKMPSSSRRRVFRRDVDALVAALRVQSMIGPQ